MGTTGERRNGWALEVVRGRDAGRGLRARPGRGRARQRPGRPARDRPGRPGGRRRPGGWPARHASLDCSAGGLAVRDLESPGGTFVNRQRVLPGQARPLQAGDVIQLGGVQLRVVDGRRATARPAAAGPGPAGRARRRSPIAIPGGPTCRTWDDFLTVSAQRWEALRDELTSGRLAAFLALDRPGRPRPVAAARRARPTSGSTPGSARLPTTRAGPARAGRPPGPAGRSGSTPGGGHDPADGPGRQRRPSPAPVDGPGRARRRRLARRSRRVRRPAVRDRRGDRPARRRRRSPRRSPARSTAELVIEGNGGSKRVAVVLEAKAAPADLDPAAPARSGSGRRADPGRADRPAVAGGPARRPGAWRRWRSGCSSAWRAARSARTR